MTKKITILSAGIITLLILAIGWAVLPNFVDYEVNESAEEVRGNRLQDDAQDTNTDKVDEINQSDYVEYTGAFEGVEGHTATGAVTVFPTTEANYIRFDDNTNIQNGPDLYVYVGDSSGPKQEIARLKGNVGGQNYELPEDIAIDSFDTVWIWCKAFSVDFAKATLK